MAEDAADDRGGAPQGERDLATLSGESVQPVYRPLDGFDPTEQLGVPGEYPFTRGVYPSMYRGRLWTMRQFAGFGTAAETNERYRFLLERGQGGLSVAFDMPTLIGIDSDDPRAEGEVGRCGVATDTLEDFVVQRSNGVPMFLLANAVEHARSEVRVDARSVAGETVLVVEDDGPGVPEADRQRIFERFVRLDGARSRSAGAGTGLGLAIVRSVVDRHGGTVEVTTARSNGSADGTRFTVRLPHRG